MGRECLKNATATVASWNSQPAKSYVELMLVSIVSGIVAVVSSYIVSFFFGPATIVATAVLIMASLAPLTKCINDGCLSQKTASGCRSCLIGMVLVLAALVFVGALLILADVMTRAGIAP